MSWESTRAAAQARERTREAELTREYMELVGMSAGSMTALDAECEWMVLTPSGGSRRAHREPGCAEADRAHQERFVGRGWDVTVARSSAHRGRVALCECVPGGAELEELMMRPYGSTSTPMAMLVLATHRLAEAHRSIRAGGEPLMMLTRIDDMSLSRVSPLHTREAEMMLAALGERLRQVEPGRAGALLRRAAREGATSEWAITDLLRACREEGEKRVREGGSLEAAGWESCDTLLLLSPLGRSCGLGSLLRPFGGFGSRLVSVPAALSEALQGVGVLVEASAAAPVAPSQLSQLHALVGELVAANEPARRVSRGNGMAIPEDPRVRAARFASTVTVALAALASSRSREQVSGT